MTAMRWIVCTVRSWVVPSLMAVWAVALLLVGSVLMVGHWVVLPIPAEDDPKLGAALRSMVGAHNQEWLMVHVLYSRCRCSQRIFNYLFERPHPEAREVIVLVEPDPHYMREASAAGYQVVEVTPEQLKSQFNIDSAPLLLIADPGMQVRYAGGYTGRKQGLDYQDLALLHQLQGSRDPAALPLYGCRTSRQLQAHLDPIGIKYERQP